MKINPVLALATLLVLSACKTAGPNGVPVYDPVRSAQVVAALTVPVQDTVNRVIRNSPQHSDEIANYIRLVGNALCQAKASGQLTPEQIISAVEAATAPLQAKADPLIITVKNTVVALYAIFYYQRHTAELPPDQWPAHVVGLFCDAINRGLKDAGKPGTQ